jgi:hypothetical protein
VYVLDLDRILALARCRYSHTDRTANNQPEIFRALLVMSHLKEGVTSFVARLRALPVLAAACGFEPVCVPGDAQAKVLKQLLFTKLGLKQMAA